MVIAGKSLSESHLPDIEYHFPEKLETEMRDEILSFKLKKKRFPGLQSKSKCEVFLISNN